MKGSDAIYLRLWSERDISGPFWLKSARPTDVSDFPTQRTVKEEDTTNITTDVMNHYT